MVKRIEELCRRQKELSDTYFQENERDPAFVLKIALTKLEKEFEEAQLSDDERTRRLAEAKKDIEGRLDIEGLRAKRKQTVDDYFALDHAILEKLQNMQRFLERKLH